MIDVTLGGTLIWKPEAAFVKPFMRQFESVTGPVQALEHFAVAVDEHKKGTGSKIGPYTKAPQPA